jgi:hypothetical protein
MKTLYIFLTPLDLIEDVLYLKGQYKDNFSIKSLK